LVKEVSATRRFHSNSRGNFSVKALYDSEALSISWAGDVSTKPRKLLAWQPHNMTRLTNIDKFKAEKLTACCSRNRQW
jgi:hypothetical protein